MVPLFKCCRGDVEGWEGNAGKIKCFSDGWALRQRLPRACDASRIQAGQDVQNSGGRKEELKAVLCTKRSADGNELVIRGS
jgi:hypothetical protein